MWSHAGVNQEQQSYTSTCARPTISASTPRPSRLSGSLTATYLLTYLPTYAGTYTVLCRCTYRHDVDWRLSACYGCLRPAHRLIPLAALSVFHTLVLPSLIRRLACSGKHKSPDNSAPFHIAQRAPHVLGKLHQIAVHYRHQRYTLSKANV